MRDPEMTGKTMISKHLRVIAAVCAALVGVWSLDASTRKGDKLLKQAEAAEAKKDWDQAVDLYQQAADQDPKDAAYVIGLTKARFEAGQVHVETARKLRGEGKLQEAVMEFQKAIVIDPSSAIALQELKRTVEMINRPNGKPEDRALTPAQQIRKEDDDRNASIIGPPVLKPTLTRIPTIKINNQPLRRLYETVGAATGINVVIDPAGNFSVTGNRDVTLSDVSVEQAFDYLALLTHTYWKPISSNTIFVTEESTNKRRDYEDFVVKVFYVTNATTAQEFQEISTAVRTITNIRQVFTYNAQKALIVRGSVDAVVLADKLIRDLDKPKSEVVVDLLIIESNSTRTKDLAATLASAGTAGLNLTGSFTPPSGNVTGAAGAAATNSGIATIQQLGHLTSADFSAGLPGALLQAVVADNRTKILNSPQVRASDGQTVKLVIGDSVPIATGSLSSGVGTVGTTPYAQTQFQFKDVGLTVSITPQVHSADEVTLHLELEVSTVKSYLNVGGVSQPLIGTNRDTTDVRLHEGEMNIVGGLDGTQNSSTSNGIPGLVNIPILGKILFGNDHTEKDRQQLMIAMIPHIVRTPDYSRENLRGIMSGYDQVIKMSYAAPGDDGGSGASTSNVSPPGAPATPTVAQAPPGFPTGGPPLIPGLPFQAGGPPPGLPPATGGARVSFLPSAISVSPNQPFVVNVQLNGVSDAFSLTPMRIKWDPAVMRLTDATPGDLLSRDNGRVSSVKDIRNDTGEATLTLSRAGGSAGVSGSGPVAILNFVAIGNGSGTVSVTEMGLKNSQSQPVPVTLGAVQVAIQ